jgi:hypothetical protein
MCRLAVLLCFVSQFAVTAQQVRFFGESGSEATLAAENPGSPLNPRGVLDIQRFTDASDLTLFGDITAADKRWKLQLKLRASNDWRRNGTSKLDIGELSFSYSATPWLDLRIGRKIERWGTGYAWNPTGVVNPRKNPSDPNDRRSLFRGADMAAADIFVKGWQVTVLGTPQIAWNRSAGRRLTGTGWAVRAYRLIKGTDVAFTASGGNGLANSRGISLARVFGNSLELHAEAAYIDDTVRLRPRGEGPVPVRKPHPEILVGGQYTFSNNVNVIGEFYHAGQGFSGREWNDFRVFGAAADEGIAQGNPLPLMLANAQFTPLQMSRNYTFARVLWPIRLNRLEVETIVITSLRDGSSLIRPGIRWRAGTNWSLYCIYSEFTGNARTEFGHIQIRRGLDIGIRYHFSFGERKGRER